MTPACLLLYSRPPLDLTSVVSFGLQAYGGVYNNTQQSGAGAMELDTIALFVIDDRDLDSSSTLGAIAVKNDQWSTCAYITKQCVS